MTQKQWNIAILMFDEIITGFRFSMGGAQELLGVTPDLASFAKGISNGIPLSAIVGKKEYMQVFQVFVKHQMQFRQNGYRPPILGHLDSNTLDCSSIHHRSQK